MEEFKKKFLKFLKDNNVDVCVEAGAIEFSKEIDNTTKYAVYCPDDKEFM